MQIYEFIGLGLFIRRYAQFRKVLTEELGMSKSVRRAWIVIKPDRESEAC